MSNRGKFSGLTVDVSGTGRAELTQLLSKNNETEVYATSNGGLLVKIFDLDCGKPDEVSYGPYLSYGLELENFEHLQQIEALRTRIPTYYGSHLDAQRKFAFIVMEYLEGENLLAWCSGAASAGYPDDWPSDFRATIYETLSIVRLFHEHGIILIDFKPDNVIRLYNGGVKFVDMGTLLTPKHSQETEKYFYSATPDYAELVIDTSNVQAGIPLRQGSDIFAAGVALFEMATGNARLGMAAENANRMLAQPAIYRFRDTQIRDVWRSYPHLKSLLPLVETQLKERRLLFSEFWHVLKGSLTNEFSDWESSPESQQRERLLSTGMKLIEDRLPPPLKWLATPIAQATTLRRFRLKNVAELMELVVDPISEVIREDISRHNGLVQFARDLDPPIELREPLNAWEVRRNPSTDHWAIYGPLAASQLRGVAPFTFLKETSRDEKAHRFFQIVGDMEADEAEGGKLTLENLANDHSAWLGA